MHVADDRRVDRLVAAADQLAVEEVLQFVANDGPLGQPEDQARADRRVDHEQFELLAQHAVIAPLGLFHLPQMVVEFLLGEEGRAVEPLQLLARGVALPIGPGHRQQLERPDRARAGHVRAAAEIDELALPIERNGRLLGQPVFEVLHLQRLPQIAAELDRLLAVHLDPLERLVLLDDPGHLGLDLGEVGLREGVLHLEIVVEAVGHRRPEGQLHAVEQPHHRPGHHVRTRMAQQIQGLGVLAGDQAKGDLAVGGQRLVGPHQAAVHFGGQRGLGQTRADVGGNVDRSNATRVFEGFSVGQGDFQHRSPASLEMSPQRAGRRYKGRPAELPAGRVLYLVTASSAAPFPRGKCRTPSRVNYHHVKYRSSRAVAARASAPIKARAVWSAGPVDGRRQGCQN